MKSLILSDNQLDIALDYLHAGYVVAMPTETVYGLAGDATNDSVCQKIFTIKGRAHDNPLISHFADPSQLAEYNITLNSLANDLLRAFAPGPLTLVVKAQPKGISSYATAGLDTMAIRFPLHPLARDLLQRFGKPLVAPSANLSGRYSSTTAEMVFQQLGDLIPAIIDGGACSLGLESSVLLVEEDKVTILRYGTISYKEIAQVVGANRLQIASHLLQHHKSLDVVLSPGIKYAHYQPYKPLKLFGRMHQLENLYRHQDYAILAPEPIATLARSLSFGSTAYFPDAQGYATSLYASLASADNQAHIKEILAYYDPTLGDALCDRLKRSSRATFL